VVKTTNYEALYYAVLSLLRPNILLSTLSTCMRLTFGFEHRRFAEVLGTFYHRFQLPCSGWHSPSSGNSGVSQNVEEKRHGLNPQLDLMHLTLTAGN